MIIDQFTKKEREVADILLELPDLINRASYNNNSNNAINHDSKLPIWVSKKRRSLGSGVDSSPSPPPPSQCVKEQVSEVRSPRSPLPSREPPHNLASTSKLMKQKMAGIKIEERQTTGIKIEERQERVTMCVDDSASTSMQLEHRVPLMLPQKKEPRGFDLNVAWVDEEEEEEPEAVEEISYAQRTKLNRQHRMMILKKKKLPYE